MRDKALRDVRDEQQELEALHRLDEECVHQQRAGNYLKAFDCMERALVLRRHFFGIESEEVIQACRALAEMCNLLAMSFLQQDNYTVTIDLLKKAEVLTQRHHPAERATTLNNLACYYRRLGKLHSAMTSLQRALELEKRLQNVRNAADTQLNMCAVLSQLGKHQEALEHAQEALIALQEGFIHGKNVTETTDTAAGDTSSSRLDRISVMCIAYHNVGVEQEFLKDFAESVASYKKGISLSEQYLGADHSITTTIRNSYLAAKRSLASRVKAKPRSDNRPEKAGARLLLSPRSGSLRMPSPLAKEKDRHNGSQIPTPRSIIADALSRSPVSALPPLVVQSPPSASKKKAKNNSDAAPTLSPTDPFFSPRFRFDSDAAEPKAKKVGGVTSPRSATAANVKVQTPPTGKDKRGRRKSSVKKPQATVEADGRIAKTPVGERKKTASTPRPSEQNVSASEVASREKNNYGAIGSDTPGSSGEKKGTEPTGELPAQPCELNELNTEITQPEVATMSEMADGPVDIAATTSADSSVPATPDERDLTINHGQPAQGSEEEVVTIEHQNDAIYNKSDNERQDQEQSLPTPGAVPSTSESAPKEESNPNFGDTDDNYDKGSATANPDPGSLDDHVPVAVNIAEPGDTGTHNELEVGQVGDTEDPKTPEALNMENGILSRDKLVVCAASTDEIAEASTRDQDNQVLNGDVIEADTTLTKESLVQAVDEDVKSVAERSTDDMHNDSDLTHVGIAEHTSDENVEIQATNEPPEASTETAIEDNAAGEDCEQFTAVDDQSLLPLVEVERVSDAQYNEESETIAREESTFDRPLDPTESDQTISVDNTGDREEEEAHFSNDFDEFATISTEHETQEHLVDNKGGGVLYDDYYSPTEHSTPEVEAHGDVYEELYQDIDGQSPLDPGFVSQQIQGGVDAQLLTGDEQDWSHVEQIAVENTPDYSGDYQDPPALLHEEQVYYDEPPVASEYVDDGLHVPGGEEFDLPSDPHPNESSADGDINAQDLAE